MGRRPRLSHHLFRTGWGFSGKTVDPLATQCRRVSLTATDAAASPASADVAALRMAAAKWSGKVSILGSAEFRERMARMAAREGIGVENHDLQAIVRDERERMALGEPGPRERAELDREARQQRAEQAEQEADDEEELER
ncbi:MAG: LPD7 domain-containing protein [Acidiferrobacter sp.]